MGQKNLVIIYMMTFMDLLAIGLTFPVLYGHVRTLGGSNFFIGVLGSAYSTIQVLSGPLVGSWSDIRGRKPILIITLFLSSVCYLLLGVTESLYFILILRVLLGLVKHTQTLCKALVADLFPQSKHAAVLGRSAAFGSIGFVVGPVIGGHLSEYSNGFFYISSLTSSLFLINIVLAYQMTLDKAVQKVEKAHRQSVINTVYLEILKIKSELKQTNWANFWEAFLLRFLFGLSVSIYFSNQALFIQDRFDLSQKNVGYIIAFISVIGVISGFTLGHIKEKFYETDQNCLNRLLHNFAIFAICFLGLSSAWSVYVYLVFLIPFSVASVILRNVSMELIIQKSDENKKGSLSGASNSLMSIARSISPIVVGAISSKYGDQSVMITAFVPSLLGMVLCGVLKYKHKSYHVD